MAEEKVVAALLDYFRQYWSVGELRVLIDMEERGFNRKGVERALRVLVRAGLLERGKGCYNFRATIRSRSNNRDESLSPHYITKWGQVSLLLFMKGEEL